MARRFLLILLLVAVPQALMAATLRVGMSADYPPLTYKQEGKMVGLEADNARAVLRYGAGRAITFEQTSAGWRVAELR